MTKFVLVLMVAAWLDAALSAQFLGVVGAVAPDGQSVRFLYEADAPLALTLREEGSERTLQPPAALRNNWGSPSVVLLRGLQPGTRYRGTITSADDSSVSIDVRFTTLSDKLLFLSCNRIAQDNDTTLFPALADAQRDLAIHMGDQVYLDDVVRSLRGNETKEELVARVRAVYRRTWMQPDFQRFLLSSRHLMIPVGSASHRARTMHSPWLFPLRTTTTW